MVPSDREPLSVGTNEGTTGECARDGRGCMLVKTLSGHLARKRQRGGHR